MTFLSDWWSFSLFAKVFIVVESVRWWLAVKQKLWILSIDVSLRPLLRFERMRIFSAIRTPSTVAIINQFYVSSFFVFRMRSYRLSLIGRVETGRKRVLSLRKRCRRNIRIYIQWSETWIHFDRWTFENVELTNIFSYHDGILALFAARFSWDMEIKL